MVASSSRDGTIEGLDPRLKRRTVNVTCMFGVNVTEGEYDSNQRCHTLIAIF